MESYDNLPTGCDKHDNCETCPFLDCVAQSCNGLKQKYMRERHKKVLYLAWNKVSVELISQRVGLSPQSVRRVLRENK